MNDIFFSVNLYLHRYGRNSNYYTDPHQGSAKHFLTYIEQGFCRFVSDQIVLEAKAGEYLYIPKGLVYHSHWYAEDKIRFKSFGFLYLPESDSRQYLLQKIHHGEALKALMDDFPTDQDANSRILGRFYSTVADILPSMRYDTPSPKKLIIEKARQYITYNETCSVPDIAKHCLISESALYDIFKKEAGCTPNEFRQQILCEKASMLLATTDRSVQEVSNLLHFSSVSYFRKILRKYTGKTPSQIRHSLKSI